MVVMLQNRLELKSLPSEFPYLSEDVKFTYEEVGRPWTKRKRCSSIMLISETFGNDSGKAEEGGIRLLHPSQAVAALSLRLVGGEACQSPLM